MTPQEPERWLTADDELAELLRPALRVARGEGPSGAEHERVWEALAATLPLSAANGTTEAASMRGSGGTLQAAQLGLRPGWWMVAFAAITAGALAFAAARLTVPAPNVREAPPTPASARPELRSGTGERAPEVTATVESTAEVSPPPAQSENVGHPHRADGAAVRVRPQPRATPEPRLSSVPVDLAGELDLLARARRIVGSAPERALQLTAEHARRYPHGVLAQEREVVAIDALARMGHTDLASARASRFAERYPDSAHRVVNGRRLAR